MFLWREYFTGNVFTGCIGYRGSYPLHGGENRPVATKCFSLPTFANPVDVISSSLLTPNAFFPLFGHLM